MSVRKSSHGTIFLIVSSGSPRALIASSLRSTSKKPFCPITSPLPPPMTAHGHRVRFVATWREEFLEVPSWCFHAVGSSNAPLLGSTAAEGLPRIGRTSIATHWRSCGLPQSASCSENFVISPDVFGQTLRPSSCRRPPPVARWRSWSSTAWLSEAHKDKAKRTCGERSEEVVQTPSHRDKRGVWSTVPGIYSTCGSIYLKYFNYFEGGIFRERVRTPINGPISTKSGRLARQVRAARFASV